MKNFTLAIAALAAVTLVSSTSFAATPFCGTSSNYNSRYDSRYDSRYNHTASNYNHRYNDSAYNSRNYQTSYRPTSSYSSLTNRLNSLYSSSWSKPLFTDYTYRARTSRNTYPTSSNRYNNNRHDRHDHDHDRYKNNSRYGR